MPEFRALWLAQILSVAGDQLARVALTLLVYDRTRSPLLAAITFAASVVPTFIGGIVLSGLADRLPRREVMIVCDLIQAGLVAVMALPGMPVGALVALLFTVTMVSAPFMSARAALYPDILPGDRYVLGTAVTVTTVQFAQVIGFAVGGLVVAFVGVRTSLLADAGTFALSALITRIGVRARPAARPRQAMGDALRADAGRSVAEDGSERPGLLAGARAVFTNASLRTPMLYGWLVAFLDVHEGIAAPLAASLGGGAIAVGVLLAAGPLGTSVGVIGFSRLADPVRRIRWMPALAVASCAVLVLFALDPYLAAAVAIIAVSGVLSCYQLAANAAFVSAAPASVRSQAFGIVQAGMSIGQGAAMVLAGAAAERYPPFAVIAMSGAVGTVAAVLIGVRRGPR